MANKSVYQDYDIDALNHFGLNGDPIYGVIVGSEEKDVLLTQDQTTYEKIRDTLSDSTETGITFINKKKAFILPKCDVSQDRLKAALKEHGIKVTNDYTQADLIVGHSEISRQFDNGENIQSSILLAKLWNYNLAKGYSNSGNSPTIANLIDNSKNGIIVTTKITEAIRDWNLEIERNLYDEWMITGLAINLAYIIETTNVSVVDPETILCSSANKLVMDEELLTDITRQLNGGVEDRVLAAKIIPTIDYTKNYHLLWQFAQDNSSISHNFNQDKDVQYWMKESQWMRFYRASAQDMILWLERNDKLNSVSFRYLEPTVRREISINNRDLYVFQVSVKKEYQKYLTINKKEHEKKI
jgi:hypothetical protein